MAIADRANNLVAKAIQEGKVDTVVKTDDLGRAYVMVGDRKVEVLPPNRPQAPAVAPGATPGAPSRSASGAIRTPVAVDADGIPVPRAPSAVPAGTATPNARGLLRTPNYSSGVNQFSPD